MENINQKPKKLSLAQKMGFGLAFAAGGLIGDAATTYSTAAVPDANHYQILADFSREMNRALEAKDSAAFDSIIEAAYGKALINASDNTETVSEIKKILDSTRNSAKDIVSTQQTSPAPDASPVDAAPIDHRTRIIKEFKEYIKLAEGEPNYTLYVSILGEGYNQALRSARAMDFTDTVNDIKNIFENAKAAGQARWPGQTKDSYVLTNPSNARNEILNNLRRAVTRAENAETRAWHDTIIHSAYINALQGALKNNVELTNEIKAIRDKTIAVAEAKWPGQSTSHVVVSPEVRDKIVTDFQKEIANAEKATNRAEFNTIIQAGYTAGINAAKTDGNVYAILRDMYNDALATAERRWPTPVKEEEPSVIAQINARIGQAQAERQNQQLPPGMVQTPFGPQNQVINYFQNILNEAENARNRAEYNRIVQQGYNEAVKAANGDRNIIQELNSMRSVFARGWQSQQRGNTYDGMGR